MFQKPCSAIMVLLAFSPAAHATEIASSKTPAAVLSLDGCWEGLGSVTGKVVTMAIIARPIVLDAMFELDAKSSALAESKDRYAAHLIFGGTDKSPGATADPIVAFWADSFGGAFTALGRGTSRSDGFDITYKYPDGDFVNRWRVAGDRLAWQIVARDAKGSETPFASYSLRKTACSQANLPF